MAVEHRASDERSNLTSSNKFELLLYRLGSVPGSDAHELYGINVFKVREISTMPAVTPIAGSSPFVMGAVDIRGVGRRGGWEVVRHGPSVGRRGSGGEGSGAGLGGTTPGPDG